MRLCVPSPLPTHVPHGCSARTPTSLNMIIRQCFAFLKLLAVQSQTLLRRRDALFFPDLYLHRKDGIRRLCIERDRLSGKGFDE